MAFGSSSLPLMLFFGRWNDEEDHMNQVFDIKQDDLVVPPVQPPKVPLRKRKNPTGISHADPDAEVIALSPTSLMTKNRFVCEVCGKGFPREQNLQLHKRGHNLPWKLTSNVKVKRKVYLCPEPSCIHHNPSHALGDLTGIKKHYSRKHITERNYKCVKCAKTYAVESDLKAHLKSCGKKEYRCRCDTCFSRRENVLAQRSFCEPPAKEAATKHPPIVSDMEVPHNNLMITPSTNLNIYKPPPTFFMPNLSQQKQHIYQQKFDTRIFNNMVNNTTCGGITSDGSTSIYLSRYTGTMPQLSTTGLLQTAGLIGSLSSNNNANKFLQGYASSSSSGTTIGGIRSENGGLLFGSKHFGIIDNNCYNNNMNGLQNPFGKSDVMSSIFNHYVGVTYEQEDNFHGSLDSGGRAYDDGRNAFNSEQQPPQNTLSNLGFQQYNGVACTRDFLGVGGEMGNINNNALPSIFGGQNIR